MEDWQIETTNGACIYDQTELPPVLVPRVSVSRTGQLENHLVPLREALEEFCYDLLSHHQPGWENNEGSHGDFVFDVASGTIALEHNQRFIESILTATEF